MTTGVYGSLSGPQDIIYPVTPKNEYLKRRVSMMEKLWQNNDEHNYMNHVLMRLGAESCSFDMDKAIRNAS